MGEFNILSIDFDYFQIVDEMTIAAHYPDGHDFNTSLSSMIWSTHYANERLEKELLKVKVDRAAIGKVKTVLKFNRDRCQANMIANSHVYMNQLLEMLSKKASGFTIYNLDMHHDMFDTEIENGVVSCKCDLNCGNWASYAKKNFGAKIVWIKNKLSDSLFPSELPDEQTIDLNVLDGVPFDAVFLCRSDQWVPPHLDSHFDKLKNYMRNDLYESTFMDPQVDQPRDIANQVKELRATYKSMNLDFMKSLKS